MKVSINFLFCLLSFDFFFFFWLWFCYTCIIDFIMVNIIFMCQFLLSITRVIYFIIKNKEMSDVLRNKSCLLVLYQHLPKSINEEDIFSLSQTCKDAFNIVSKIIAANYFFKYVLFSLCYTFSLSLFFILFLHVYSIALVFFIKRTSFNFHWFFQFFFQYFYKI